MSKFIKVTPDLVEKNKVDGQINAILSELRDRHKISFRCSNFEYIIKELAWFDFMETESWQRVANDYIVLYSVLILGFTTILLRLQNVFFSVIFAYIVLYIVGLILFLLTRKQVYLARNAESKDDKLFQEFYENNYVKYFYLPSMSSVFEKDEILEVSNKIGLKTSRTDYTKENLYPITILWEDYISLEDNTISFNYRKWVSEEQEKEFAQQILAKYGTIISSIDISFSAFIRLRAEL